MLVLSGCEFNSTTRKDIPDYKRTFVKEVNPDFLHAIDGNFRVPVTIEVWDLSEDDDGTLLNPFLKIPVRAILEIAQESVWNSLYFSEEGDIEPGENGELCYAFDYWMKSRKIENTRLVKMDKCAKAIRETRESATLFGVFIRTYVYETIAEGLSKIKKAVGREIHRLTGREWNEKNLW